MTAPWGYVCHQDGRFAGAIVWDSDRNKAVAKFCGKFIRQGFTVTPVYSREEYLALIAPMPIWQREKKKTLVPTEQPDMFEVAE